ncbi:MAG: sigma-70 family RNA polymerase sigma factor [Bryobacterales bacterium]|nr:sigma-70 family RNA polymerase sigma factor [Bryobacterales bacterium]
MSENPDLTQLLQRWGSGDSEALDRLLPLVYGELRRIAGAQLRKEHAPPMQATELVHELYMRIQSHGQKQWESRNQFYAVCTRILRYLLTDHARRRLRQRRGEGDQPLPLQGLEIATAKSEEIIGLDDALSTLEQLDARKARVVELRFFGGFELEEIAALLEISPTTIKRDWAMARAWLYQEMRKS